MFIGVVLCDAGVTGHRAPSGRDYGTCGYEAKRSQRGAPGSRSRPAPAGSAGSLGRWFGGTPLVFLMLFVVSKGNRKEHPAILGIPPKRRTHLD